MRRTLLLSALLALYGCQSTSDRTSTRHPAAEDPDDVEQEDEAPEETPRKKPKPVEGEKKKPEKPQDEHSNGEGGPKSGEQRSQSGLRYIVSVPADNQANVKAHGLLVLLHGSGASNYRNLIDMMSDVGRQEGLILVSVLAPNGGGWNEGGEERAADHLHALIQQDLYPKYNVDKSRVFFSGQSSGGGFLGSNFVAQHAKDYKGGAFLQCGAEAPRVAFSPDDATKKNFRLVFRITSDDPIWPRFYDQALKAYGGAGMQLKHDESGRGGHCAFDQQRTIQDNLAFVLGK